MRVSASVLLLLLGSAFAAAQDTSLSPPVIVRGAGPFTVRQLAAPPAIDGREWIAAEARSDPEPATIEVPGRDLSLRLTDAGADTGDFERYKLMVRRGAGTPLRIDDGFTGWVYVTPDGRYIITEPLDLLDVESWQKYPLSDALNIPNYTSIDAVSRDGRRLLISQRDCAIDCPDARVEYYELTFPPD